MRRYSEDTIYDRQYAEIKKRCGQDAADNANYGWGVDFDTVATKVYGHGVLVTYFEGARHEWQHLRRTQ